MSLFLSCPVWFHLRKLLSVGPSWKEGLAGQLQASQQLESYRPFLLTSFQAPYIHGCWNQQEDPHFQLLFSSPPGMPFREYLLAILGFSCADVHQEPQCRWGCLVTQFCSCPWVWFATELLCSLLGFWEIKHHTANHTAVPGSVPACLAFARTVPLWHLIKLSTHLTVSLGQLQLGFVAASERNKGTNWEVSGRTKGVTAQGQEAEWQHPEGRWTKWPWASVGPGCQGGSTWPLLFKGLRKYVSQR